MTPNEKILRQGSIHIAAIQRRPYKTTMLNMRKDFLFQMRAESTRKNNFPCYRCRSHLFNNRKSSWHVAIVWRKSALTFSLHKARKTGAGDCDNDQKHSFQTPPASDSCYDANPTCALMIDCAMDYNVRSAMENYLRLSFYEDYVFLCLRLA